MTEGPVLVISVLARIANGSAVPKSTDGGSAFAGVSTASPAPTRMKTAPLTVVNIATARRRFGWGVAATALCRA